MSGTLNTKQLINRILHPFQYKRYKKLHEAAIENPQLVALICPLTYMNYVNRFGAL